MDTDRCAPTWSEAFERVRDPGYGDEIVVPRAAEPELPATMALRRSPPPLSLRRGATAVYRQDERGEHYQIREYERHWTVSFQDHNPHYAPVRHLLSDVSLWRTVTARLGFGRRPHPASSMAEPSADVERR